MPSRIGRCPPLLSFSSFSRSHVDLPCLPLSRCGSRRPIFIPLAHPSSRRSCADACTPFALRSLAICGRVAAWTHRWQGLANEHPWHELSVKMFTSRADFYRGINFSVRKARVASRHVASRRRRPPHVQARE